MPDWDGTITRALKELHADSTLTRGAILKSKVNEIAKGSGLDFDTYLNETGQKFSSVVEQVNGVVIHRRPNTDMFVGLGDATWPDSTSSASRAYDKRFRADIYEAFTRISERDYWYLSETDEFTNEVLTNAPHRRIPVPSVTLDHLLSQRRIFAEEHVTASAKDELIRAIDRSPNPLAAFQAEVSRQRLGQAWHSYKSKLLTEQIEEWADDNEVHFLPNWVESGESQQSQESPQQLMARFATFMTDEEVRSIAVPFRAVEAMLKGIGDSTKNSL